MLQQTDLQSEVLQAIYDIGETFCASLRMQPVLERIVQVAMHLARGDAGSVMLLTADGEELVVAAAMGPRAHIILGQRQPANSSVAGRALQVGDVLLLKGRLSKAGPIVSDHPQDTQRSLVVPLRVAGRLVGVLNVNSLSEDGDLSSEANSLIRLLANQATLVIENARLYEDLSRKERRLELFVDKFLRLQSEQRTKPGIESEEKLKAALAEVMRQTVREFIADLHKEPEVAPDGHTDKLLSDRERQVLALVVEGLINKEIGQRLGVSPNTVKNHIANITRKLGVADRTQAAVMSIRQGLLG